MNEMPMSDLIRATLDGVKEVTGADTCIGTPIHTPTGVTVIPISRISVALATGGLDSGKKITAPGHFGGGGGTGILMTPIAVLTVGTNAEVHLTRLDTAEQTKTVGRVADAIARLPDVWADVKNLLF